MLDLHVVVLAAGKGTRMKSARPKVLHRVAGAPMIDHVLETAARSQSGLDDRRRRHQADEVQGRSGARPGLTFVVQEPQLGTGHALLTTETPWKARRARGPALGRRAAPDSETL